MRLHDAGERLGRARIGEVAALGGHRHRQVLLDQPGDAFRSRPPTGRSAGTAGARLRRRRSNDPRAAPWRCHAGRRRHRARGGGRSSGRNSLASGWSSTSRPRLDAGEHADRAQQMLVDGVVVIHAELHHPDDAPEIGHETAQHAGFVHVAQHDLRRAARGQDFEEHAIGLGIVAQGRVDAIQRMGDEARRVGMNGQIAAVGDPEQPDQIGRIALEGVAAHDADAIEFDLEVLGVGNDARAPAQAPEKPVEHRARLGLPLLQRRANDRGEIADVLGDQEIVLHEALGVGLAGARAHSRAAGRSGAENRNSGAPRAAR